MISVTPNILASKRLNYKNDRLVAQWGNQSHNNQYNPEQLNLMVAETKK